MQSKAEIITALQQEANAVAETVRALSEREFITGTDIRWSAEGYLKHLILSVKPFASVLKLPQEALEQRFGKSENGSMNYEQLIEKYNQALTNGIRAENSPKMIPVNYKMPDNVEDTLSHLVETWEDANQRLTTALEAWSEDDLDTYQLPHPAIGTITMREMCFFTVHHNQYHHEDIKVSAAMTHTIN